MARNVEFNEVEAIQKAMEVFWKKGYGGASLRDLTDAMKINSSSLYNTIGDKHELFIKCIKYYTESKMEEARKLAKNAKSPLTALIDLINATVNAIINGDNSCLAIKTAFEIAADDKSIQTLLKADSDFQHDFILAIIKDARKQGELSGTEDPEMFTDYLISLYTGWYESYILHQDPIRIRKMAKYLITQLSQ
jgi:TetR/AcrR family transcriptional repressor of nem operon